MNMHDLAAQQSDYQGTIVPEPVLATNEFIPSRWKSIKLLHIAKEFINGGTPSTTRTEFWDGSIPWITSATISDNAIKLYNAQRFITEQGLRESSSHLVPKGSLLIGTRVGVGKAVVNLLDTAISQDLTGVVLDTELVQPEFVAYQFKTERMQNVFNGQKRGTTIKGISRFDLELLRLYVPPLSEQHTITHILQTIQNAIQALHKELELERERKVTLMQRLFTRGTRNEPTKQSEIGEIPESWKIGQLGDVIQGIPQNGAFIKDPHIGSGTLYVNVYDIYQNTLINFSNLERIKCDPSFIDRYSLKEDDIIFVRSSLKREGVGQCCVIKNLTEPAIFDCHLIKVSPNVNIVDPLYLTNYFLSERGKSTLIAKSKTTTMTTMNQNTLTRMVFPLPSLKEQRSIAAVLQTCNSKITTVGKELLLLEELFHALLEELMTGKLSTLPLIDHHSSSLEIAKESML